MIDEMRLRTALESLLPGQRWFGSKDHAVAGLRDIEHEVIDAGPPALVWVAVTVDLVGAAAARYHAPLGVPDTGDAFDALAEPSTSLALLAAVAPDERVTSVRPLGAEQSNTSLVFDERLIMKVYRRPPDGPNPDAEITAALAAAGFPNVAPVLARWSVDGIDRAIVQPFLAGSEDGWALAVASAGGSDAAAFAAHARQLGAMTAAMHVALSGVFGVALGDADAWAAGVARQVARTANPSVDAAAVDSAVATACVVGDAGRAIRLHGDYHLGQTLRRGAQWYVLDFEGEPVRPLAERRTPSSPLKDVAGMLRSFDYAAEVAGGAREWEQATRAAFLEAYRDAIAGHGLVPEDDAAFGPLLTVFELEKAVYEVGYEAAHRPGWVDIPLAAVRRLLEPVAR